MMRVKLIGANRASFHGAKNPVVRNAEVDVDDAIGETLLARTYKDAAGSLRPIWELVASTEGDSAAELDYPDIEDDVEEDEEEETAPPPAAKKKAAPRAKAAAPKRQAAPKAARSRTRS